LVNWFFKVHVLQASVRYVLKRKLVSPASPFLLCHVPRDVSTAPAGHI
jgi:hypothetical protein